MKDKKIVKISIIFLSLAIITTLTYYIFFNEEKIAELEPTKKEEPTYSSNIIKDVEYITTDADGNEYIITSIQGEIDFNFPNIIYLTKVKALIKLKDSNKIIITSDYGKYNTDNFDTIFSKNVLINYLDNKIKGEYLDFSINRSTMIMSKEIVYSNLSDTIEADVIEINIKNKDTKIFMYNKKNKVSIKKKN